jgi:hypothetical protein
MHRLLAGAAAVALLAAPAVATADVHRYQTVRAVESGLTEASWYAFLVLAVTGVDDTGDEVTHLYTASWGSTETMVTIKEQCDRMALLALAKPGRYRLEITDDGDHDDDVRSLLRCKLVRND